MVDLTRHSRLTAEEAQKVQETLSPRIQNHCELCKRYGTLTLSDYVYSLMPVSYDPLQGFGILLGDAALAPSIQLSCSNCGNTKLINLLILGIRPREFPLAPKDDAATGGAGG